MDIPAGWDADTVADALYVLDEMPDWRLAPPRWKRVLLILDRLSGALARADAEQIRDAVADLELSGPTRIQQIGTADRTGVPDLVLERRNTLVHTLAPALEPRGPRDDGPAR
jgi:hypothetical protein